MADGTNGHGKNGQAAAEQTEILRAIWNQMKTLNQRMERGFRQVGERLDRTNERLDRLTARFDHFVDTAGGGYRAVQAEVEDLKVRVTRLERRRS